MFTESGDQELRSHVQPTADPYYWFEGTAIVPVAKPVSDNAEAAKSLFEDEPLQLTLLHPLDTFLPPDKAGAKLASFQERFAATPYADYARYALARHHCGGYVSYPYRRETAPAVWIKRINALSTATPRLIISTLGLDWLSPMERDDLVTKIQSIATLPLNQQDAAKAKVAEILAGIQRRDADQALELLRQISNTKFPYYAYAKILEMRILRYGGDDQAALAIEAALDRNFASAFEWIDYRARHGRQRTIYPHVKK